jgi:hypothetical protein
MIGRSKDDWMIGCFCCVIGSATVNVAVTHHGGGVMVATAAAGF